MTIWRMRIACWITKVTDTHSEYVLLKAFLRQHWLRKHASMLDCTYIVCQYCTKCCSHLELLNSWKCFHAQIKYIYIYLCVCAEVFS